jgi:hypothetical protein
MHLRSWLTLRCVIGYFARIGSFALCGIVAAGSCKCSSQICATQPYVAPLLLEPLILVGAALALLAMVACSKWITQGRITSGTYRKYTFKYNRRSFTAAVQVTLLFLSLCLSSLAYVQCSMLHAAFLISTRELFGFSCFLLQETPPESQLL